MELSKTPLNEAEFYRRLDALVPGDDPPEGSISKLSTELYCERVTISGLDEMHRYSTDERLYSYFEFQPFEDIAETRAYIEKLQHRMGDSPEGRTAMYWFVRKRKDNYLIGTMTLVNLNYQRQAVEWGYAVDPELWGEGYVLQIQEMLKKYVFEVLRLHRLHGVTMLENRSTISSVLLAGMVHEGTLRHYYKKDGIYHDGWAYSMLAEEYVKQIRDASMSQRSCIAIQDVIHIVSSILEDDDINEESTMRNVCNWDSLNHMTIMVAVSEKSGISFSPEQITRATSVKAIFSIINGD